MSDTTEDTPVSYFLILAVFFAVMAFGMWGNHRLREMSAACVQSGGIYVKTVEGFRCLTR